MVLSSLSLVAGLLLLTAGAEVLVRGGASMARRLGVTPLVVGLTVIAYGTSTPEVLVSTTAALRGSGDISVGNVVGSNIFNVGIILGLAAMISPIRIKVSLIKLDVPLLIAVSLLAAFLVLAGGCSRLAGLLLVALLVGYTIFSVFVAGKRPTAEVEQEFDEGVPRPTVSLWLDVVFVAAGLGLLFLGADLFVKSAMTIARSFGVSEAVIGLTIVAAGTSMPELATSVVAALRGQPDIAVGNIVGSNIFNLLGVLGLSAALQPLTSPGIAALDLWVMVGYSVALLPLLWTGQKLQRWEGLLLFAGYLVYLWILWPAG